MKFINKLTFLGVIIFIICSAQLIPNVYRIHYILITLIIVLGLYSLLIKKYKMVELVPGVGKHREEIDIELVSNVMGNLVLLICVMLIIFEIGELFYRGFTRTFIWFSIIPLPLYIRFVTKKMKE